MPFAATTMCVLIIGSMVATNVVVVKAAGLQILTAVLVRGRVVVLEGLGGW